MYRIQCKSFILNFTKNQTLVIKYSLQSILCTICLKFDGKENLRWFRSDYGVVYTTKSIVLY